MRFLLAGEAEWLPADWTLHLSPDGRGGFRATVERDGRFLPLGEALALRDVLVTASKPHVRAAARGNLS